MRVAGFAAGEGAEDNELIWVEFKISSAISISDVAKFLPSKLSGSSLLSSGTPEELAKKCGIVVGLSLSIASNSSKQGGTFYTQISEYVSVSYTFLHPNFHTDKLSWISPHHPIFFFFLYSNLGLSYHSHVLWLWSYWKRPKKVRDK